MSCTHLFCVHLWAYVYFIFPYFPCMHMLYIYIYIFFVYILGVIFTVCVYFFQYINMYFHTCALLHLHECACVWFVYGLWVVLVLCMFRKICRVVPTCWYTHMFIHDTAYFALCNSANILCISNQYYHVFIYPYTYL